MEPDSSLDQLGRDIYARKEAVSDERSSLHGTHFRVAHTWTEQNVQKPEPPSMTNQHPKNWYKKFFFGALIIFVLAIVALGISFLNSGNHISADNVTVTVLGKTFADGGEPLTLQVAVTNKNSAAIELASLVLQYPDAQGTVTLRRNIGTVGAKDTHTEEFLLKLYGQEGSTKALSANVEYRVHGSNAILEQSANHEIVLRSSPLRLTVKSPEMSVSRQKFPTTITVSSNSTETITDVLLSLQFPDGYEFASSNPTPTQGTNLWNLGDMTPGSTKTVIINGSMSGVSGEAKVIQVTLGSSSGRGEGQLATVFETKVVPVNLQDAFLGTTIAVNGQKGSVISLSNSNDISVEIAFRNTLQVPVRQAEIQARLSGNAFNVSGVSTGGHGFYNSATRSVVWSAPGESELASIPPGGEGTYTFSIKPLQTAGANPIADPTIMIDTSIKGITDGGNTQTVDQGTSVTIKLGTVVRVESESHYGMGVFKNTGPFPPKANKETTYTVTWKLSNSSNTLSGVTLSTTLPTNVVWKNAIAPASQTENLLYNEATRTITWSQGTLSRGVGFGNSPKSEVSFQVGITPSVSQIGEKAPLTTEVLFKATDSGTNLSTQVSKPPITTRVSGEGNGPGAQGMVTP